MGKWTDPDDTAMTVQPVICIGLLQTLYKYHIVLKQSKMSANARSIIEDKIDYSSRLGE